jgi:hypothetical protein
MADATPTNSPRQLGLNPPFNFNNPKLHQSSVGFVSALVMMNEITRLQLTVAAQAEENEAVINRMLIQSNLHNSRLRYELSHLKDALMNKTNPHFRTKAMEFENSLNRINAVASGTLPDAMKEMHVEWEDLEDRVANLRYFGIKGITLQTALERIDAAFRGVEAKDADGFEFGEMPEEWKHLEDFAIGLRNNYVNCDKQETALRRIDAASRGKNTQDMHPIDPKWQHLETFVAKHRNDFAIGKRMENALMRIEAVTRGEDVDRMPPMVQRWQSVEDFVKHQKEYPKTVMNLRAALQRIEVDIRGGNTEGLGSMLPEWQYIEHSVAAISKVLTETREWQMKSLGTAVGVGSDHKSMENEVLRQLDAKQLLQEQSISVLDDINTVTTTSSMTVPESQGE